MSRACYKGIWSYKINIENTKNIIKQQVFGGAGQAYPSELRPVEKSNKLLVSMVEMSSNWKKKPSNIWLYIYFWMEKQVRPWWLLEVLILRKLFLQMSHNGWKFFPISSSQKSVWAFGKILGGFSCSSSKNADKQDQLHVGLAKQHICPISCIIPAPITYVLQSVGNLLDIFGMRMGPPLLPSPPSLRALISMR